LDKIEEHGTIVHAFIFAAKNMKMNECVACDSLDKILSTLKRRKNKEEFEKIVNYQVLLFLSVNFSFFILPFS